MGFDVVKKVMSTDGHLVGGDTYPYYLRERKWAWCIHDELYAIRDIAEEFNTGQRFYLSVHIGPETV
jgi:hypothetical protein